MDTFFVETLLVLADYGHLPIQCRLRVSRCSKKNRHATMKAAISQRKLALQRLLFFLWHFCTWKRGKDPHPPYLQPYKGPVLPKADSSLLRLRTRRPCTGVKIPQIGKIGGRKAPFSHQTGEGQFELEIPISLQPLPWLVKSGFPTLNDRRIRNTKGPKIDLRREFVAK